MKLGMLNVSDDGSEVAAIEDKSTIRSLWFRGRLTAVDFSTLPNLVEVGALGDVPDVGNLRDCPSVRRLRIVGCRLRDLTPLAGLAQLEELEVEEAPLKSLVGIEELTGLRQLHLSQLPLERLDGLRHATKLEGLVLLFLYKLPSLHEVGALTELKKLSIDGSKRAADVDALSALSLLEELELVKVPVSSGEFLSGLTRLRRLILDSIGTLPSMAFLARLTSLEHCELPAIADGDMSVLLRLPRLFEVRFNSRRHYSHSRNEIRYVLASRWTDGTGSFENERARRMLHGITTTKPRLGTWSDWFDELRVLSVSERGFARETVPADYAQRAIATAEVVAHGGGQGVSTGAEAEAIASWCERLDNIEKRPPLRLVMQAIGALDRIVREPSELPRLWRERGALAAWLAAVAHLRGRLETTRESMSRTYGVGSFDNEPALRYVREMDGWSSPWGSVHNELHGMSCDSWRESHPMIPAFEAQAGIAMAETVAQVSGHGAIDGVHAAEISRCTQMFKRGSPSLELIDRAINALDRIVREPSGLLQYWTERGELAAWLAAVAELRGRLELARAECAAAKA